jgi:hypothetical protein
MITLSPLITANPHFTLDPVLNGHNAADGFPEPVEDAVVAAFFKFNVIVQTLSSDEDLKAISQKTSNRLCQSQCGSSVRSHHAGCN